MLEARGGGTRVLPVVPLDTHLTSGGLLDESAFDASTRNSRQKIYEFTRRRLHEGIGAMRTTEKREAIAADLRTRDGADIAVEVLAEAAVPRFPPRRDVMRARRGQELQMGST